MRPTRIATILAIALSVTGCFKASSSKTAEEEKKGQLGVFYIVNVSRPVGGAITTPDGQLNCGTLGSAKDACGPATFSWNVKATLTAVPDAGQVFVSWAGDCGGVGTCTLDTVSTGADKYVVAVFNSGDRVGHTAIPEPAQHGPLFFDFVKKVPNTPKCNTCHGPTYTGLANAPSCESCHATAGFPNWLQNCGFCHGDPPALPHVQLTNCSACHSGYGDNTGPGNSQVTNAATHMNGAVDVSGAACTACHGTNDVNAAPPLDTQGRSATTFASVGAHQVHLVTTIAKPVACGECHTVPSDVSHATSPPASKVKFGPLANKGTTTVWTAGSATCASTYCHGGSTALAGGVAVTPVWTLVDGSQKTCTSCHGSPPPAPHPQNADCAICHSGYTAVRANAATHVDGVVDVRALTCSTCHGDPIRTGADPFISAAPPLGTNGETVPSQPAVGAHLAHLQAGALSRAFACTDCHSPPFSMTHANGAVEFSFSVLAGGTAVAYDATARTCSNTYCHGNFTGGNAANRPVWTAGAAGAACGSCHGSPPAAPHTQSTACGSCHAGYTATSVNTTAHVNGIVDVVALSCTSCHGTTNVNAAPPLDASGRSATTLASVGAHQSHVRTTLMAAPIACTECHGAASAGYGTGHADSTVQVQFGPRANQGTLTTWNGTTCASSYCHGGTTAVSGGTGVLPAWTTVDGTYKGCGSCHGSPPPAPHVQNSACGSCHTGYTNNTVAAASHINGTVNVVLGPTSCNVCHGAPPATSDHRTASGITSCSRCHDTSVDASGNILANGTHRNGSVELSASMSCASCHGTPGRTPNPTSMADEVAGAPPKDLSGNSAASFPGVGAHLVHTNGLRSKNLLCSECHDISSVFTGLYSHANGTVEMLWGNLAKLGGVTPTYVLGSGSSCNSTYCHGNFPGGAGAGPSPAWTTSGTLGCSSCHGAPPALNATSHHPGNTNCGACHGAGYASTTVVQATHVDGTVNVSRTGCTLCHGDLTQTGVAATSAAAAPGFNAGSADTVGNIVATAAAVGAHAAHVNGTRWRGAAIACNECHTVPGTGDVSHATGAGTGGARATVNFGSLARTGGITTAGYSGSLTGSGGSTAGTCSNTYCHGNFTNGVAGNSLTWLGGAAAANCGSCHGLPPGGTHSTSTACESCHGGYTIGTVNGATHLNGSVDVSNMTCTSCHGDAARASVAGADLNQASAPPVDTNGSTTGVLVGTHLSHVNPAAVGQVYKPVACTECHTNNAGNNSHSNNAVNVTFAAATAANLGSFTATFLQGNGTTSQTTCATYCHGSSLDATTSRGSVASWSWNGAAADCGSCHKSPPGTANHHNAAALTTCSKCHGGTVDGTGVVNVAGALHVNGAIDTSTLTCTTCHGNATLVASGLQDPNVAAAPTGVGAPDTFGNTAIATANGVGVHASHVLGSRSRPVQCNACHSVPGTQIHKTGVATAGAVALANLSTTGGIANASYAGAGGTCSNVYCHGNFPGGVGATATATWKTEGTLGCTSCHGAPPALSAASHHPANADCATCHGAGYSSTTVVQATHVDGAVTVSRTGCTLCHGDLTLTGVANTSGNAAPGFTANAADTTGATAATAAAVGAHAAHLTGTSLRATPISCSDCHAVPGTSDVTHATGTGTGGARATVAFSGLAVTGTITTAGYAGSTTATGANGAGTCSNTYCHGNFKNGSTTATVSWLGGTAAAACGSCHGLPPGGTHPASANCASCHSGYTASTVNTAIHLNGSVDVINMTCTSCHGDSARASVAGADLDQASAPPLDTVGANAGVRVGTHLSHVNPAPAGAVYKPVACTECHTNNAGNSSHSNNTVNVTFAAATGANLGSFTATLAQGDGAITQTTCATYCHGSSLNATTTRGSVATWSWNGAAADCGSCHKSPPGTANHHNAAALTTCSKCHGGTVDGAGVVNVAGALHVNGAIDTSTLTCTTCHGNATLVASGVQDPNVAAAPTGVGAPDTFGNTTIATANGVGVHASHVLGARSRPVQCNACHTVPGTQVHKTGVATAGAVVLANLSITGGIANATYAGAGGTCSNTYCHGNLGGGVGAANVTPTWKTSATLVCNSCHGMPPATTSTGRVHPSRTDCGSCHTGYTSTSVSALNHVNGAVEYATQTCTTCHGDSSRTGLDIDGIAFSSAPPADSSGLLTGGTKIGAHAKHLLTGAAGGPSYSKQVACGECHSAAIPVNPLHADGQPNVAFGTLARTGGITTTSFTGSTCSNTYCHGNFTNGAGANPITWTTTGLTCTSCHGTPPGGTHPAGSTLATCGNCHGNYSNGTQSIVDPAGHVNGQVDLSNMSCTSCHGSAGRISVAGADVNQISAPPVDTLGATTGVRVGTHVSHVNPLPAGAIYKPIACTECHTDNTSNAHANGIANVTFAAATGANLGNYSAGYVLRNGTTVPETTCATYCHGATLDLATTRGSVSSWTWNGAAADCGSCHKSPPGTANHHNAAALTTCNKCHGGTVDGSGVVNVAGGLHVNGTINTSTLTCTTCHGNATLASSGLQDANVAAAPTGAGAPDTYGNTAIATANGVGVHAAHVLGTRSRPVQCNACHGAVSTPIHKTGVSTAGAVTLANLSTTGGIGNATYAGNGGTCSNVYCHGNFAGGAGAIATPTWKTAGALACTSCHQSPPTLSAASHHPANAACASCHGTGYTSTTVVAATHVDGINTLTRSGCTLCHGDLTQTGVAATSVASAPGFNATAADTTGATAASSAAVGAHFAHLTGTRWRATALACSECHTVPGTGDVTHATGAGTGGARATVAFGTLARTGNILNATYAGSTTASGTNGAGTCSNVYCHGNFTNGATGLAVSWLGGTSAAACGSCHGDGTNPRPGGTHPASNACESCHTGYTVSSINPTRHMDGTIDRDALTCTSCHGQGSRVSVAGADLNQASAPPLDSLGASTGVRVGVHEAHVNPAATGAIFRPIACVDCHPNNAGNNSHSEGTRNVILTGSTTANLGGLTATWTLGNGTSSATTCTTYCHGATMGVGFTGSVGANWSWTGTAATCGSCHGFPPSVSHTNVLAAATDCNRCHGGTVNLDGSINVAGGLHINGQGDGGGEPTAGGSSCGGCHAAYFDQMTAVTGVPRSRHGLGSDVPLDGASSWTGTTLSGSVPLANRTCISMCHGDHPHTLTSPPTTTHENNVYFDATTQASRAAASATRVGAGGTGTQNRAKTDFDSTAGAGVGAGLCASCHQTPIVANGITVSAATFGASAHDFSSNTVGATTYTWSYGLHDGGSFARNCTKCHASRAEGNTPSSSSATSVHYSTDDVNLLAGTTNPAGVPANFACYNCHGSTTTPAAGAQGNRSGKDIQTQVVHATTAGQSGHPSDSDTRHDSAAEFASAAFGNALGVTAGAGQRHASCMDCHDSHEAKATADAAPYSTGTVGISTTGTCPTAIGGGSCGTATGNGTTWTSAMVGWKIQVGTAWYTVVQFTSATSMLVYPRPTAAVATGSAYSVRPFYRVTNVAGPALQGAWGAALSSNPAFWTAPTTANFTKGAITAGASAEATLCFKCHTGYYWGTGTTPVSPSGFTYTTGTAAFTAGSATVTGTGTTWTAAHVGANIKNNASGVWYRITARASNTSITISPVATASAAASAYTIQMAQTDVAREFNPANVGNYATTATTSWAANETAGSYHPILASASGNLGATGNILPPFTRTSLMQCSDCHESDANTDPNGPHGSASRFILKGPNTTWNNTVTAAQTTGMPDGTFCANCHRRDFVGGRFTGSSGHLRSDHRLACFNCHSAVPHGGPRPGLLIATAGAGSGVGGTIAGWDTGAPYSQPGTGTLLGIAAYPGNNTTAWARSNCGCGSASPH